MLHAEPPVYGSNTHVPNRGCIRCMPELLLLRIATLRTHACKCHYCSKLHVVGSLWACNWTKSWWIYLLLLQVAIALSLLVAEVAGPPFHNTVMTFSSTPQLHAVQGASLAQKVRLIRPPGPVLCAKVNPEVASES